MVTLFNENWEFSEYPLDKSVMEKDGKPNLLNPEDFKDLADTQNYKSVTVPHDWMISHVKDLYKNSIGFYKKVFDLNEVENQHIAIRFESIYMNSAVYINNLLAGSWKYGYGTFELDISKLVKKGTNTIQVISVYQNPNTRWYSGAGIIRDVTLIQTGLTYLQSDGIYIHNEKSPDSDKWTMNIYTEVCGDTENHIVKHKLSDKTGNLIAETTSEKIVIENPELWDLENPNLYKLTTELINQNNEVVDRYEQNTGFKTAVFDKNKGFFLNGKHIKIYGACHHHDQGVLGAAFDKEALRRQFNKLKEMGVNSVRCSHNPPPKAWLDLADEMGIMIDDEIFDMWEKPKTAYDYGNYFNDWYEKDVVNWIKKDRNHPCIIMWSIGNEIYDTHIGNGYEITKKLYKTLRQQDPLKNAPITIASNYMMTEGAQHCAEEIDVVGYNYLERLYNEHHTKYPEWKIYGSETSSTVQSRGIYHFPDELKLVTFSDGQCSTLGNCTTTWGCANTQTVIANDRDCDFSAGQYIWTGWDYIGEPTPYHSKNSYFGQIDTAGFAKDTFYLYKSEWAYKNTDPFVHLLPYWDWNEGQIIDVKAYTNGEEIELFLNGTSLGRQKINHKNGKAPFGQWKLPYQKGELKAVAYDENGSEIASDIKRSFGDPEKIILQPETEKTGHLFFIDIMTADKNGTLVENARNYITVKVEGDAELIGMDNGDSTDYDEYVSKDGNIHSRKLFSNRLLAVVRTKDSEGKSGFKITAASKDLPSVSLIYDGNKWFEVPADISIKPEKDFIPARKIEILCKGSTALNKENSELQVTAKVLPENASLKQINWNPVLKECVASDYIEVTNKTGENTGSESAIIKAVCDGECILRCTAKNGTDYDEVISDLNFFVEGVGNPKLNPYKLIEACRLNGWTKNKAKPVVSLESGISNRGLGPCWISFDKVDFGKEGADSIHLPIFSFDTELPVEVWDGTPENGDRLLSATYKHESVYNIFSENIFTLKRRLFGVHTISIFFPTELVFHGFYFDKTPKAFAKLWALDADTVVGDTFTKTETAVEGIGNNVNLDFSNMDFGETGTSKIIICGKSNTENNTINLKFFDKDGNSTTQVIEFSHTDDYEEKIFELDSVKGEKSVSFVFLPGCNFDFKWFKFV